LEQLLRYRSWIQADRGGFVPGPGWDIHVCESARAAAWIAIRLVVDALTDGPNLRQGRFLFDSDLVLRGILPQLWGFSLRLEKA